jgi:hypothetical protein
MAITKIQSESLNLADTYDFTGTVTGAGESNVPYFNAKSSSSVTYSSANTWYVGDISNVSLDTASGVDTSNERYTPNVAGKYFFAADISTYRSTGGPSQDMMFGRIMKNGTEELVSIPSVSNYYGPGNANFGGPNVSAVVTMNGTSDYVTFESFSDETGGNFTVYAKGYLISTT